MTHTFDVAIGADHRGFELKKQLVEHDQINGIGIKWHDYGASSAERSDYPLFAKKVVENMKHSMLMRGILLCGTGAGMAIAANRAHGIRAAVAWNDSVAGRLFEDDGVNILVLPADYIDLPMALNCISAWLSAKQKQGRYEERIKMVDELF